MDTSLFNTRQPIIVDIAIDHSGNKSYSLRDLLPEFRFCSSLSLDDELPQSPPVLLLSPSLTPTSLSIAHGMPATPRSMPFHETPEKEKQNDLWAPDVQHAFEEVLAIVPKNGLNKVKVSGRSCGRNELISDYIYAKTGKFRSRKQVLSHIQVIKNMGHPHQRELVRLINDGPRFASPIEAKENNARFEEIFSNIYLKKLLGGIQPLRKRASSPPPRRAKKPARNVSVRNIRFDVHNPYTGCTSALTFHRDLPHPRLLLNHDAQFSSRFPGIHEFTSSHISTVHSMVRLLHSMHVLADYAIETDLSANFCVAADQQNLCCFSTVYSHGIEIHKVRDEHFQTNTNTPFLSDFWRCFFAKFAEQPHRLDDALRAITVQQVLYEPGASKKTIAKKNVRAVLLWEFSVVYNWEEALTLVALLQLPPVVKMETPALSPIDYSYAYTSHVLPSVLTVSALSPEL